MYWLDNSWINSDISFIICIGRNQFTHYSRLLINFFQHIVRISSFTNIRKIKFSCISTAFNSISFIIGNCDSIFGQNNQLFIVNFHKLTSFTNHSHGIWTNHVVTFTNTNQKWRFVFGNINRIWCLRVNKSKRIWPLDNMKRFF